MPSPSVVIYNPLGQPKEYVPTTIILVIFDYVLIDFSTSIHPPLLGRMGRSLFALHFQGIT